MYPSTAKKWCIYNYICILFKNPLDVLELDFGLPLLTVFWLVLSYQLWCCASLSGDVGQCKLGRTPTGSLVCCKHVVFKSSDGMIINLSTKSTKVMLTCQSFHSGGSDQPGWPWGVQGVGEYHREHSPTFLVPTSNRSLVVGPLIVKGTQLWWCSGKMQQKIDQSGLMVELGIFNVIVPVTMYQFVQHGFWNGYPTVFEPNLKSQFDQFQSFANHIYPLQYLVNQI